MLTRISNVCSSFNVDSRTSILSLILVLLFWRLLFKNRTKELLSKIPGPRSLPIIGNTLQFLVPREQLFRDIHKRFAQYGSIYKMWLGSYPIVVLSEPEYVEEVLHSSKHLRKSFGYRFLEPFLGSGLITSSGKKWLTHRKILTPAFHFKILDSFLHVFQEQEKVFIEKIDEKAKDGTPFDIYDYVKLYALDVVCEAAMGVKVNAQNNPSEYVHSVLRLSNIIVQRFTKTWLHPNAIFNRTQLGKEHNHHLKVVHGFVENVIQERKKIFQESQEPEEKDEEGRKKRRAFLDLLLATAKEEKLEFTDTDIREEVDTFMFAGHDTTTAAITWAIYLLGLNPKVQEEVYREQQEIFEGDMERPILQEDLVKMNYLDRVMKESIRIYPSVPAISRTLDEDVKFGDYIVPKNTTALVQISTLHRNPKIYPDPEKFDPDRFLPENVAGRHSYAYVPFSAGPRNCIGKRFALLEEKFVLASIFRRYKVESIESPDKLDLVGELILRCLSGIKVRVKRRGGA